DVAVTFWNRVTAADLAEQVEIAEAMGFHSFWLPESHFTEAMAIPSPLMVLTAVASRTSRIRLGSTSYLLPIRHPIQAAEEVAVLDRLSGGRVILGVGRGYRNSLFTAFDVPVRDKRKQFKQNLEIMIDAWRGEPIAWEDGEPVHLAPLPVQQPHPPLWVAAFGPLAIKQAGTLGLPYLASPAETMEALISKYARHREFAIESNQAEIDTIPVMRTLFISDNPRSADRARQNLAREAVHRMRDPGSDLEQWAIIGDAVYAKDKLSEYIERLNVTHLIARGRIPGIEHDEQIRSLESLAAIADDLAS
ncbi:MAG: LLM class flavin-dependent oxidoreductase, partial [Pseudomonadales bacterium]|nr:LLM class flavin-dependent oxidoreductase [Pseudomonadales bacterium]